MNFHPIATQMTFHPEAVDGRTIIVANLFLFGVVSDSYKTTIEHNPIWLACAVFALELVPAPMWLPQPSHQILNGISNLMSSFHGYV